VTTDRGPRHDDEDAGLSLDDPVHTAADLASADLGRRPFLRTAAYSALSVATALTYSAYRLTVRDDARAGLRHRPAAAARRAVAAPRRIWPPPTTPTAPPRGPRSTDRRWPASPTSPPRSGPYSVITRPPRPCTRERRPAGIQIRINGSGRSPCRRPVPRRPRRDISSRPAPPGPRPSPACARPAPPAPSRPSCRSAPPCRPRDTAPSRPPAACWP
jgi:hypothetical protein